MPIALPSMIRQIDICDLCEEWSRISGKRVESEAVNDNGRDVEG
jgi:hypothetical protein